MSPAADKTHIQVAWGGLISAGPHSHLKQKSMLCLGFVAIYKSHTTWALKPTTQPHPRHQPRRPVYCFATINLTGLRPVQTKTCAHEKTKQDKEELWAVHHTQGIHDWPRLMRTKSQFNLHKNFKWEVDYSGGKVEAFHLFGCNWVKWKRTYLNLVNSERNLWRLNSNQC